MGRRKVSLSRRPVFSCRRSLHSDGLAEHARGRLCDRTPQWSAIPQWSCIQHSGVSLRPSGQLSKNQNQLPYPAAAQPSQAVGEEEIH